MQKKIIFRDLGLIPYQQAWDYQEKLLQENVAIKSAQRQLQLSGNFENHNDFPVNELQTPNPEPRTSNLEPLRRGPKSCGQTSNYLLFVEHPPVYTLGKSGNISNVLLSKEQLEDKSIGFFHTNRGGDITYHGPGQIVGYPILDLENFDTDIGKYLRRIEETIILTLAGFGIKAERSAGETGVWIEPSIPHKARKICAIGVRCSRWITMHGFALNVNTELSYFNHIIPCGIVNKQVTSIEKELGQKADIANVKEALKKNFEFVFDAQITDD